VSTDAPATEPTSTAGGGNGLTGVRERIDHVGGQLTAGPSGAGWAARATFPLTGATS
jgi:signal transduction histidine kinase